MLSHDTSNIDFALLTTCYDSYFFLASYFMGYILDSHLSFNFTFLPTLNDTTKQTSCSGSYFGDHPQ